MAWNPITEADILTVLAGPELEGIRAAALKDGQVDPVQPTVDTVTAMVRGYIAGWSSNVLGPDGTIPDKLKKPALDILAVDIPTRVSQGIPASRITLRKEAVRLLERVSEGKFEVEEPATPSTEDSGNPKPTVTTRKRRFTYDAWNGI